MLVKEYGKILLSRALGMFFKLSQIAKRTNRKHVVSPSRCVVRKDVYPLAIGNRNHQNGIPIITFLSNAQEKVPAPKVGFYAAISGSNCGVFIKLDIESFGY